MLPLNLIAELENRNIVTRTFRRLDFDKQDALYQAALEVFADDGYDKASMDKIAQKIGTGGGALYRYVENKEKLFHFVAEILLDELAVKLNKRLKTFIEANKDSNVVARIYKASKWLSEDNPDEFKFALKALYEFSGNKTKKEFYQRYHEILTDPIKIALKKGIADGLIRDDIDVEFISTILLEVSVRVQGADKASYLSYGIDANVIEKREAEVVKLLFEGLALRA